MDVSSGLLILILFIIIIFLILFFYIIPIGLWITALAARVKIGLGSLVGMRLRKIPPSLIVNALINAQKAGLDISSSMLETHYMAGGNESRVVNALIASDKASIPLTFQQATAIDLAGRLRLGKLIVMWDDNDITIVLWI